MKIKSNRELLLNGNIGKAILALAVPVVINSFLQTMYNLTDTYWLGRLGTIINRTFLVKICQCDMPALLVDLDRGDRRRNLLYQRQSPLPVSFICPVD